jgi:hypothetical protein
MRSARDPINIVSTNYWFKVVEFLQTNWVLLDESPDGNTTVWFIDDTGGVFDHMHFPSLERAEEALMHNGFDFYQVAAPAQRFLNPPQPPFHVSQHPSGQIYSSGQYWR